MSRKPLIAHVLYRLDTGGMERMLVTVINHTQDHYRHAVICLAGFGTLRHEIESSDVECLSLDKKPGKDWLCHWRLWRVLRRLKPDLVHSYNLGTLDMAPVARLAGVPCVVHAERGRDAEDPTGESRKYRRLRRWMAPFIARYLPVSRDLEGWLLDDVGIDESKVLCISNGIDVRKFAVHSGPVESRPLLGDFAPPGSLLIINVSRLDAVKDQAGLIDAFQALCSREEQAAPHLKLAIVGEGKERVNLESQIAQLGLEDSVRLLGNRQDVPALLSEADIFVLSSIAEGMPGAVLEGMASGLPVVATRVGGVTEIVADGETGSLVDPSDPEALAVALGRYVRDPDLRLQHGRAGRARVERRFSLAAMLSAYSALYDGLTARRTGKQRLHPSVGITEPKES